MAAPVDASQHPQPPAASATDRDRELALFRQGMDAFKREQEAVLLDMTRSKPKSAGSGLIGGAGGIVGDAPFLGKAAKGDVTRVLDTDVILVAVPDVNGGREKWPSALVANFPRSVAELGFMESNGSLWRLVKRDGNAQDGGLLKVLLHTAEIGEKEMFLSPTLELVKDSQQAAVWVARVIPPTVPVGTLQLQAAAASNQGLLIQLEMLGSEDGTATAGDREPKLLVTASSDSGEGGVAILTEKQRLADTSFRWGLVWEVVREDTFVDGLDDLARELELAL